MYILEYIKNNMGQFVLLNFYFFIGLPLTGLINLAYKLDKLAQVDKKGWANKEEIKFCIPSEKNRKKIRKIINKNSTYNNTQLDDLSKVIINSFRATIIYSLTGVLCLLGVLAIWVMLIKAFLFKGIKEYPTELGMLLGSGGYSLFILWMFYGRSLAETLKLYRLKKAVDNFVLMIVDKMEPILEEIFSLILAGVSFGLTAIYMLGCEKLYNCIPILNYRVFMFIVIGMFYFCIVPKILSKICIKMKIFSNKYLKYSDDKICKKLMNNGYLNLLYFYLIGIFMGEESNIILVIIGAIFLVDTYIDREKQLKNMN